MRYATSIDHTSSLDWTLVEGEEDCPLSVKKVRYFGYARECAKQARI